jgi:hypothetical protein
VFAAHQLVKIKHAIRTQWLDVPAGARGVVIDVHPNGAAYEIEFQDHPGVVVTVAHDALDVAHWGDRQD